MTGQIQCPRCKPGKVKQILFCPAGIEHRLAWGTIDTQHFVVYCDQRGCWGERPYSYDELPKEIQQVIPHSWGVDKKGTETSTDN